LSKYVWFFPNKSLNQIFLFSELCEILDYENTQDNETLEIVDHRKHHFSDKNKTPRHIKKRFIQLRQNSLHQFSDVVVPQRSPFASQENDEDSDKSDQDMSFDSQSIMDMIDPKNQPTNKGVYVEFCVFMNRTFIDYKYQLSIAFLFVENDNHHTSFILNKPEKTEELVDNQVKVTINIFIPLFILKAKKKIAYYYYLTDTNLNHYDMDNFDNCAMEIEENLLVELKKLRYLDNSLLESIEKDTKRKKRYARYDGYALFFGDFLYSSIDHRMYKTFVLKNLLNIQVLRDHQYRDYAAEFIQAIIRVNECLCLDDEEYKTKFEQVTDYLFETFIFLN